jgi:hypothetical protein
MGLPIGYVTSRNFLSSIQCTQSGRENIENSIGADFSVVEIGFAKRDVLQKMKKRSTKRNRKIRCIVK